jgi:hypothetical protein
VRAQPPSLAHPRRRNTREPPTPPASSITATDLALLVQRAARAVTLTVTDHHGPGGGEGVVVRFGTQTDT